MEELKDKPEEAGAELVPGEGISVGKFRLSKRALILGVAGLLVLSLIVAGIFAYRSSARQKEAALAQKREQVARELAAKAAEKLESDARAKELHRAHEEVLSSPSTLPGIFSSPAREGAPKPVSTEKPSEPAAAVTTPLPPASEHKAPGSKKPEAKPVVEKTVKEVPAEAAGIAAPTAAGGCALSGGKAEDYGKALGKCLEDFNRLEGRKPNSPNSQNSPDGAKTDKAP